MITCIRITIVIAVLGGLAVGWASTPRAVAERDAREMTRRR